MSALIYSKGTDLHKLSLELLWKGDWPPCMECGGPLMRSAQDRAEVKSAGKCNLDGNVTPLNVSYVAVEAHFYCLCCIEYHWISWYFFYNLLDDARAQCHSIFYGIIKAPRLEREYTNPDTLQLLRGIKRMKNERRIH